ncbi:YwqG family protein [Ureibacillus xyleni]|uniref:YwqG family protein n=1 Tax=Ureibacillus xyleni TaxID=614648 RepID=UPI00137AF298|nr:YwqG family protein [Ureibacillus xyleni]
METKENFDLPQQLEGFRDKLIPSLQTSSIIVPYRSIISLTQSKFAGYPYLPKIQSHPKDSEGNYMYLLAQINFSEATFPEPFPTQGLLQIFISKSLCNPKQQVLELLWQHNYKVRYYPTLLPENEITQDFSYLNPFNNFPIENEMGLKFTTHVEPVSATDYRLEKYFKKPLSHYGVISDDELTLEEIYFKSYLGAEHKIGGYPYFIESDTRKNSKFLESFDTLLLQIVSNDDHNINYGDTGVLKFFINSNELMNLDFSKVYLHAEQY